MAWTYTTNGWTILRRANVLLGMAGWNYLGQGQANWTADDEAAKILSECERKVWSKHVGLENTYASTTLTVSANANSVALPAAVDHRNVLDIIYNEANDPNRYEVIRYVPYEEWRNRSGGEHQNSSRRVPTGWTFSLDNSNILFMQKLEQETTLTLEYRSAPTEYADTDLTSGDATYSSIPDQHIKTVVYEVAIELADRLMKDDLSQKLRVKSAEADEELHQALIENPAAMRRGSFEKGGFMSPALRDRTHSYGVTRANNWRY